LDGAETRGSIKKKRTVVIEHTGMLICFFSRACFNFTTKKKWVGGVYGFKVLTLIWYDWVLLIGGNNGEKILFFFLLFMFGVIQVSE
jgi:hypothetical protein